MYKQYLSYDIKIILGDMNAVVGKEIWAGITVGICSYMIKVIRTFLINYAVHQCVVTGETLFPYRYICKGTWHGSDDRTVNQTNHVMIDQRYCSNILDVRSYRGSNADLYSYLVIAQLRCSVAQKNNQNIPEA
jgi:hypothetical protein